MNSPIALGGRPTFLPAEEEASNTAVGASLHLEFAVSRDLILGAAFPGVLIALLLIGILGGYGLSRLLKRIASK